MNEFKSSRRTSFIILALVYIIAGVVGIVVYKELTYAFWLNLLIADTIATIVTFIFSLIFKNASVYDPYWSVQPIVIVVAYALGYKLTSASAFIIIAICVWGIRLTANWAYTFINLNHQDWRYTMLHEKTGIFYPVINFVGIHMVPTLVVYGVTLPAVILIRSEKSMSPLSIMFFVLSLMAVLLQGTADVQMHKYRKNRNGKFIRNGVWKYSRHPNYLAEIIMWWSIAGAAFCLMPDKWYLFAGTLANTLLFLCVSIPLADGKQSKKEGYEEYKKATRMLLPIKK